MGFIYRAEVALMPVGCSAAKQDPTRDRTLRVVGQGVELHLKKQKGRHPAKEAVLDKDQISC